MKLIGHFCDLYHCLRNKSPKPLGSILSDLREGRATDPHDKVYGCYALAEVPPNFEIRYDLSPAEVYTSVARTLIEHDESLRILSSCQEPDRDLDSPAYKTCIDVYQGHDITDLPSWAPNWGRIQLVNALPGDYGEDFEEPYRASGISKAYYKFSKDPISPSVKGFLIDKVSKVGIDVYGIGTERDLFIDALANCYRYPIAGSKYPSNIEDSLVQTFTANRQRSGARFPTNFISKFENMRDPMVYGSIEKATAGRAFFFTKQGYMGLGPRKMQANDCICLISGCHVPIVMRCFRTYGVLDTRTGNVDVTHEDTAYYHVVGVAC
jgi:hypothetical protein